VATFAPDSDDAEQIDAALKEWRQGGLALDESRSKENKWPEYYGETQRTKTGWSRA
jgi:hypothetical protein